MARFTLTMSLTGMPSVMQTTRSRPASTPSRMASAANGGRNEDRRGGGAGLLRGLGDGVEDRNFVLEELAAFAGRDAGDDLRAVSEAELGVPRAEAAGDALDEDFVFAGVDENGHIGCTDRFVPTALTTFCAASAIESPLMIVRPDSARVFLPAATLLPSSRTTSGSFKPVSFTAATMPVAMTLQSMMPPKMFTRIPFTFGSLQNDLERRRDLFLARAAADIEEVRRAAAEMLDDVHRGHGQAGAVDEAGDAAVELDVIQVELAGFDFQRRFLGEIAHRLNVLVAIKRVVIEAKFWHRPPAGFPCRPAVRRCKAD